MTRLILILFAVGLLPYLVSAKRIAPAKVEPVIHKGLRYVAPNNDGRRAYIEAWDGQTNRKLWDLTVFTNRIDPTLEEDVQWVFITSLSLRNDMLVVTFERGKTYQVDLKTRSVTQSDPVRRHRRRRFMRFLNRSRGQSRMVRSRRSTRSPFA